MSFDYNDQASELTLFPLFVFLNGPQESGTNCLLFELLPTLLKVIQNLRHTF